MWSSHYLSPDLIPSYLYGAGCLLYVFWRSGQTLVLRPVDWSVLFMGAIYGFGLPIVVGQSRVNIAFPHQNLLVPFEGTYSLHTIAAITATAGLLAGWNVVTRWRPNALKVLDQITKISEYSSAFWKMLLISGVATLLYVYDYGGLIGALEYSRLIRSGILDQAEISRFSFLSPFRAFSMLATFGFLGAWLSGLRTTSVVAGFILSFVFTLYQLSLDAGRMSFLLFFATILLSLSFSAKVRPALMVAAFLFILPAFLYLVFLGSNYFGVKGGWYFMNFAAREMSFPFTSFFGQLVSGDHLYRLFVDLLVAPMYALPSRLHADWMLGIDDLNTMVHYGLRKGEGGNTASVPVDLITFGLMQFHYIGVFLYAIIFGGISAAMYRVVDSARFNGIYYVFLAYLCVFFSSYGLFYAYPKHMIDGNFPALATLLIVAIRTHMRTSKLAPQGL